MLTKSISHRNSSLMTLYLHGWEAFPTSKALTYTRITWAFSPPEPQVLVSLRGPPCAHGGLGIPLGEVRDTHPHQTDSMPSSTILVVGIPIRELPSSMVRHCVYLRVRPPQCIFKFGTYTQHCLSLSNPSTNLTSLSALPLRSSPRSLCASG
jgi:hypothetical protein